MDVEKRVAELESQVKNLNQCVVALNTIITVQLEKQRAHEKELKRTRGLATVGLFR